MAGPAPERRGSSWPVLLLALPAFVAIWSGWVELGTLTGFGLVQPLPGIWDGLRIDSRVTLPIGMEAYAAYALKVWLSGISSPEALAFARVSAGVALVLGAAGQVAYHLMHAAGVTRAPWPVTALVACLPVAVLGMGVALAHLTHKTGAVTSDALVSAPAVALTAVVAPRIDTARIPRPANPARASRNGAGARVRALRGDHPDWTSARIGEVAGCSPRTVRRSLATVGAEVTNATATTTGSVTDYEKEAA
ncbi:hypothetical protein [Pengzhenrongella sp.]|jgi:hypothetical protein|uniref:hypothetical protein n=1 Tax=Pengzhenrongella sp. TaxID=2888820 RepID=UPI002F95276C